MEDDPLALPVKDVLESFNFKCFYCGMICSDVKDMDTHMSDFHMNKSHDDANSNNTPEGSHFKKVKCETRIKETDEMNRKRIKNEPIIHSEPNRKRFKAEPVTHADEPHYEDSSALDIDIDELKIEHLAEVDDDGKVIGFFFCKF